MCSKGEKNLHISLFFPLLHIRSEAKTIVKNKDKNQYRLLSTDPGKKDIAAVTDGVRTLRYTKGQRDEDT